MTTKTSVFEILSKLDVSAFTEKKGRFSYLSWSDAVDELLKHYPEAVWSVVKDSNGYPYTSTPAGCFVEVQMTIEGVSRSQIHPVLDNSNKTVMSPNAFQINTSLQRCLAKVIGLHGLGLYIYRGEDLPDSSDTETSMIGSNQYARISPDQVTELNDMLSETNSDRAQFLKHFKCESLDTMPATTYKHAKAALEKKAEENKQ